jgi:hypothetical protein
MASRRKFLKTSGILSALALTSLPKFGKAISVEEKSNTEGEVRKASCRPRDNH